MAPPRPTVAIVGAGAAGLSLTSSLLRRFAKGSEGGVMVEVLESLPVPFGLVRYGVAPDHPDTKRVETGWEKVMASEGVRMHFNVPVGAQKSGHIPVGSLREVANAVVFAFGAGTDRRLGVVGEDLDGVYGGREFVEWYNGYPASRVKRERTVAEGVAEGCRRGVAVFGVGNVSVDIARLILKPNEDLARTDVAGEALAGFEKGEWPRRVHLVGRRSAAQASFTPKELRELLSLPGLQVHVNEDGMSVEDDDKRVLDESRIRRRALDALEKAASRAAPVEPRCHLHFHFRRRPLAFRDSHGNGRLEDCVLEPTVPGQQVSSQSPVFDARKIESGGYEVLPCGMAVRSIGYFGKRMDGVPFDEARGVIPTVSGGRVVAAYDSQIVYPGLYACGWARRGATGIINTNIVDANEVAEAIFEDWSSGRLLGGDHTSSLDEVLVDSSVQEVPLSGWHAIDRHEIAAGRERGKPREKVTDINEMLRIARME